MLVNSVFTLEQQARIVWCGALAGRYYARHENPDQRLRAYERMRFLALIENPKYPSLTAIAHGAARDIGRMLHGHERALG